MSGSGVQSLPAGLEIVEGRTAIPDSSITASTYYASNASDTRYAPYRARLNGGWSWEPRSLNTSQWLQIDLGEVRLVGAIATQGGGKNVANEWCKSYKLLYQVGDAWVDYNNGEVLAGNYDRGTIVRNDLTPFRARYVRINPQTWYGYPSMRVEFYVRDI